MVVSRSRSLNPPSPALSVNGAVLKDLAYLEILGLTLDSKLTFEAHLRSVARSVSQKIGIMRKSWSTVRWGNSDMIFYLPYRRIYAISPK